MKNIKAVFFDLDGTLIDSKRDITASVNDLRTEIGLPLLTEEEVITHVGRGTHTLLREVLPVEIVITNDIYNRFIEYYKKNSLKYSEFYKGAIELLIELKDYQKVLITNKAYEVTKEIIKKFELEETFALVYGGDSFEKRKPDPYPLNMALKELNLQKEEVIYFGDSLPDYKAAEAAEMNCVMATYGYGLHKDLFACKNAIFVNTPLELIDVLDELKEKSWSSLLKGE